MNSKIQISEDKPYSVIVAEINAFRCFGREGYSRIVFTNGCFDILHMGHLKILAHCRELAGPHGAVVVGVNSDESVSRLKGPSRPIIDENTRCVLLVSLKYVDHVVIFDEDTPRKLIDSLLPDVIVKGEEYRDKEVVGSDIALVHFVPMSEGISTTKIVERIHGK
jgi:D-beta-D-heptose 7-phosphate kinase/D-beta-D-heptose 1-phosphate adenosyltransferase